VPVADDRKAAPGRRPRPAQLIVGVLIAVVALVGVLLFVTSQFGGTPQSAGTQVPRPLDRPGPPGWSSTFAWSAEIPTVTDSVAVGENRVGRIDSRGALQIHHADTGVVELTTAPNTVSNTAKPFIAVAQGATVAGIVDGANLLAWPLSAVDGAEGHQITLALNARLYQQGGGLMVSTGTEHWVVTSDFTLAPVAVPTDHVALAVSPQGMLLSAPPQGSWSINPSRPGVLSQVVRPRVTPPGTVGEMQVAWSSRGVIAAWGNTDDPGRRTVGLYRAATGELLAGATLPTGAVLDGLPLTVSPGAEYASAGPMLARLSDGKVHVVERWSTIMSDSKSLYGSRDGITLAWRGEEPIELDPGTMIPWGISDRGYAIVLDSHDGTQVRLGALVPS
jgi:hypothetical protein